MTELPGPITEEFTQSAQLQPQKKSFWGLSSIFLIPTALLISVVISIAASSKFTSGMAFLLYLPIAIVSGLLLSALGFPLDSEKKLATIGLVFWLVVDVLFWSLAKSEPLTFVLKLMLHNGAIAIVVALVAQAIGLAILHFIAKQVQKDF